MHLHRLVPSFCLLTGLLLTASFQLHAETQPQYAVDVVIFEDSEARYLGSEQWAPATTEPGEAAASGENMPEGVNSLTAKLDTALKPEIHDIDPGAYDLLNSVVKKLNASQRYHVLVRKTWLQPGLDRDHAVAIDLNSTADPDAPETTASISGTVKIVLERYLHMYTDLVYHKPGNGITATGDSPATMSQSEDFVIKEHRRMRSKELHYIDHPLVGILIKIVPVEASNKDSR